MKKKISLTVIICILIVVISGCIFIFHKNWHADKAETKNNNSSEEEISVSNKEWKYEEEEINTLTIEEKQILFYISDDIVPQGLFDSFINGKIEVYDSTQDKMLYVTEYYEKYSEHSVNAVFFTTEDVNGDGDNELLLHLRWKSNEGIILVFHAQDGKLYQWQSLRYGMHSPQILLYDNGVIEIGGTAWSQSFFSYNSGGELERVFDSYSTTEDMENGGYSRQYIISEYQNGIKINECSITEVRYSDEENDWELLESQNEVEEFDSMLNDFFDNLGEGKQINLIQSEEDIKVITWNELLDKDNIADWYEETIRKGSEDKE